MRVAREVSLRPRRAIRAPIAIAAVLVAWSGGRGLAMHDPDLTNPEFTCQKKSSRAAARYLGTVLRCGARCQRRFFKGLVPATDCYPPYGGATAECAAAADAKLRTSIEGACDPATHPGRDCPECYDAFGGASGCGEAGWAGTEAQVLESYVSVYPPLLFCKTTAASSAEQTCQRNATKAVAKLVHRILRCHDRCFVAAHAGDGTAAACRPDPVLPNDAETESCLGKAEQKARVAIDARCSAAGVALECPLGCRNDAQCDSTPGAGDGVCANANCAAGRTSLQPYPSGSYVTLLVENSLAGLIVDSLGGDGGFYCGE
jgi:hypothetical protein